MPYDASGVTTIPYDSSGNFSLSPGYLAISGQTILASQHNPPLLDIAAGLSEVLLRSGAAPLGGNLSAAGFKITNAGAGSADGDYVTMAQLNAIAASITNAAPTGAVEGFRRTTAPAGWTIEDGGTIGNASSGATNRANSDTEALFTLLWGQFSNTILPIQTSAGAASTRGASAAADYAANKRMPLFDSRSRFLRGSDSGLGYDVAITVGLAQTDLIKAHAHPITDPGHDHSEQGSGTPGATTTAQFSSLLTAAAVQATKTASATTGITVDSFGGTETRPRSSAVLICVKL